MHPYTILRIGYIVSIFFISSQIFCHPTFNQKRWNEGFEEINAAQHTFKLDNGFCSVIISPKGIAYEFKRTDFEVIEKEIVADGISYKHESNRIFLEFIKNNGSATVETSSNYSISRNNVDFYEKKLYNKILFKNIYPQIDLECITSENEAFKYNFICKYGSKLTDIQLKVNGGISNYAKGKNLFIQTISGIHTESIPYSYIIENGKEKPQVVEFLPIQSSVYGFTTPSGWDGKKTLVIDPVPDRLWGTYFGGTGTDQLLGSQVDASGNIFLVGQTASTTGMATAGAFQSTFTGSTHGFLSKFNSSGQLLWSTYIGLNGNTSVSNCAVASNGDVYLSGSTNSTTGISTPGAFQANLAGGTDVFVMKFNTNGARLWGTYFGGTNDEAAGASGVDGAGNLVIAGSTASNNGIAITGSFQPNIGGSYDGFIISLTENGARNWSTYYGGNGFDEIKGIAFDNANSILLCGRTESSNNLAITGAYQTVYGGASDGFFARFSSLGVREYGSFYGGSGYDAFAACARDANGNLNISGLTNSASGISTSGSFQPNLNSGFDAFLVQFNNTFTRNWATYFGNSNSDEATDVSVDPAGNIFLSGLSNSYNLSTWQAYQTTMVGQYDGFFAKFNSSGIRQWSSYYGGKGNESNIHVHAVSNGSIFLSGFSTSLENISTSGSFQPTFGGISDIFLARFSECTPLPQPTITASGNTTFCSGGSVTLTASGSSSGATYTWSNGQTGTSISVSQSGNYTVTASNPTCSSPASNGLSVAVNPLPSIASFSPTSGAVGSNVVITGNNFLEVNSLLLNGTPVSFVINSATQITATIGATNTSGLFTIANPNCSSISTSSFSIQAQSFTLQTGATPLSLCQRQIISVPFSASGFSAGTIFTAQLSNSLGFFGSATNIGTGTSSPITATIPSWASSGTNYRIRVITSSPAFTGSLNSNGPISLSPLPTISAVSPTSLNVDGLITIIGTNFSNITQVSLGGISLVFTIVSSTTITATAPSIAASGNIRVANTNCSATSSASVTVINPTPIIGQPTVSSSLICPGETLQVTFSLSGGPFSTGNVFSVQLSDNSGSFSNPTVIGSGITSPISCTIPAGTSAGSAFLVRIISSAPDLMSNGTSGAIEIKPFPSISSLSIPSGYYGETITVNGNGFTGATNVTINGSALNSISVLSNTQIRGTLASGTSSGLVRVSVNGCTNLDSTRFTIPSVTGYNFINATTDLIVSLLANNASFSLASTPNPTIQALTNIPVGSLRLVLTGPVSRTVVDGWNVYSLCGDAGTLAAPLYNNCPTAFIPGNYSITATPFKFGGASGPTGMPLVVNFTLTSAGTLRTSFDEENKTTELNCYPNPFTSHINLEIKTSDEEKPKIQILNLQGQTIKVAEVSQVAEHEWKAIVNTSDFSKGMYLVRLFDGSQVKEKLVIMN